MSAGASPGGEGARTAGEPVRCSGCGAEGTGNFCARCGTALRREGVACPACGSGVSGGALYCSECGAPVASVARKSLRAHLPWIFAGLSLLAFAAALAVFVQGQSGPRGPDGLITGGLPEPARAPAEVIPAPGAEGTPAAAPGGTAAGDMTEATGAAGAPDLSTLAPKEAADRLFDRSMAEAEAGNEERSRFFADMGLQAYERVPARELDADARFHIGLLHLHLENPAAARAESDAILSERPRSLFGLVLALRAAEAEGDASAVRRWSDRLREAADAGERPDAPPYTPHRAMLEREVERAGAR